MRDEDGELPRATELRGERLLVLAPHPDDEAIGCGGLIALHLAERRQVRVVIATDGAAATQAADPDAYRAQREQESLRGLALLAGSDARMPQVDFLRHPDRQLAAQQDALRAQLRELLVEFRPDLIAVTSPIELHVDHRALCGAFCKLI